MILNIMRLTEKITTHSFSQEEWVIKAIEEGLEGRVREASVEVSLSRHDKRVSAMVTCTIAGTCSCTRCAQDLQIALSFAETLQYDPIGEEHETEEELDLEELDIGWYEDGKLDLATVICEVVVLSLPARIHCSSEVVTKKPEGTCYVPSQEEDRTLENLFAGIVKIE